MMRRRRIPRDLDAPIRLPKGAAFEASPALADKVTAMREWARREAVDLPGVEDWHVAARASE